MIDPLDTDSHLAYCLSIMNNKTSQHYPTLKAWRHDLGLSQREACRRLGVHQATYSAWELGLRAPRRTTLPKLLRITGVPLAAMIGIAL